MRVLMFPGFLQRTWSSIEERYLWLDAPLRREGACYWLVPEAAEPEAVYVDQLRKIGAELIRCDLKASTPLHNLWRLARIFRNNRIDVVYTHFGPIRFHVEAAARLCGVAVARGEHNFAFHRDRRFRFAKRMFWRWCVDYFVPVSHAVAAHLAEAGAMKGNGMVVHDGFDVANYPPPSPQDRDSLLLELGIDHASRLLLCVAKIHPAKQQHLLIGMMPQLRDLQVPVHLLLAGDVADERYRLDLGAQVTALGLDGRVHFLGYRTDVLKLMGAAEISYLPSKVEGLGNVVIESYLMGTPVIASDLPAIREIIDSDEVGRLVPGDDPNGYAKWTRELLSDDVARRTLGMRGRNRVSHRFGRTLFEQRTVAALRQCLAEKQ